MKKRLCLMLLCISIVFCLCSCGDKTTYKISKRGIETETEDVEITTTEETNITTEEEAELETDILDKETEIYNDNGFVISILSVVDDGFETTINLVFQNNLDADYMIFSNGIAINNLCIPHDIYIAETFIHGVKTKIPITVSDMWLSDNKITEISTLSFVFEGLNEDYETEWESNKITVNTNLYDENVEYVPSCEQVYCDDNCTVWFDNLEGNIATFIVKNNTTKAITYQQHQTRLQLHLKN